MKRAIADIEPPGTLYGELPAGAIYREGFGQLWVKAPGGSGRAGDFAIKEGLLHTQFESNRPKRPKGEDRVEFLGVLKFRIEED